MRSILTSSFLVVGGGKLVLNDFSLQFTGNLALGRRGREAKLVCQRTLWEGI